ncbi:MAG: hypothetical protein GY856_17465 [bacterium]|nr:hypothetical protein [bacterium]
MSRTFFLGPAGERQWRRLMDSYELERHRGVVIALSSDRRVLSECRRRLEELAPRLLRTIPERRVVETIQEYAAADPDTRSLPVIWIEAEGEKLAIEELTAAWQAALAPLNIARERLGDRGPVFLVLAGPLTLLKILAERTPDLWSVANPVVQLGETLEAETRTTAAGVAASGSP